MKQLKFLMVAFTLLMGVSLTSCMGESDPTVSWATFMRVVETYPFYTFQAADGVKFVATNSSELQSMSSKINYNDIVYVQYAYNSDEQQVTNETKSIDAKMTLYYNASSASRSITEEGNGAGEPYENATVIDMYPATKGGLTYFDKNTLLLCVRYMAQKDLSLHNFTLVYDNTVEENAEDGVLNLYLRHSNAEEKPDQTVDGYFRAFDITDFLYQYGKTPTKIKVWINETDKSGSYKLEDAKKELQSYEVDYKSVFEKN